MQDFFLAVQKTHEKIDRCTVLFLPRCFFPKSSGMKDWNEMKILFALIHPAQAKHGLNIQSDGHILIWSHLKPGSVSIQNVRLSRHGQQKMVTFHSIVTKNTVDEDVPATVASKDVTRKRQIIAVKAQ